MSTFFQQTAQAMTAKHIDRFPLLKLEQVIDWQPIEHYLNRQTIEHYLNRQRTRYLRDHRGRPAYPLLSMFKAVLLGQWHSLRPLQNPTPTNSRNMLHHVPAVFA
ncbi:transposase [Neisseria sp. 74A18]|nr:transposase [Neisseria sp. 74A18]